MSIVSKDFSKKMAKDLLSYEIYIKDFKLLNASIGFIASYFVAMIISHEAHNARALC